MPYRHFVPQGAALEGVRAIIEGAGSHAPLRFASLARLGARLCRASRCTILLKGPDGLVAVGSTPGVDTVEDTAFWSEALSAVEPVAVSTSGQTLRVAARIIARDGRTLGLIGAIHDRPAEAVVRDLGRETLLALADEAGAILESTGIAQLPERDAMFDVADAMPAIIWVFTEHGTRFVSQRFFDATGFGTDRPTSEAITMIHPEDRALFRQACKDGLTRRVEFRYRLAQVDGTHHWLAAVIAPIPQAGGRHAVGMAIDVEPHLLPRTSPLELAEQSAVQLNVYDRQQIWSLAQDLFAVTDLDGRFGDANPAWYERLGHAIDDLLGTSLFELIHPDDRGAARQCLELAAAAALERHGEYRFREVNGRYRAVATTVRVEGQHVYFYGRDISAQRESEAQLRQAQKMEAVGQLTGGVAHDFNNLLTVILGNAESLVDTLNADTEARLQAERVMSAAERGAELTSRMLAFARRQPLDPKPTDIRRLLVNLERLLRRTIGESVEIEFVHAAGLWPAMVDAGQLESAIVNLCINARDAMGRAGRITIETANMHLDEGYARQHSEVTPGQYVMIAVSDTGSGMAPETMSRAFEPFFTTKPVGEGTGLGLSMIYGFVKQTGGHIMLYSELGIGTVVRLYLPRSASDAASPAAERTDGAPMGSETVLVVEDEAMVRDYLTKQLDSLGYRCIPAQNAAVALALLRSPIEVDLMFTDLVMPGGMNGRELAEEARRLRPGIKVLFSSGYAENALLHQGRLPAGAHLLQKPYRRQALAEKLRTVLDPTP